ncbi:molybdopterin-dependent oxidoreductase [Vreelandella gomseomensis]|nr:molybdopterin-dependent oxidoreductase [Halomonas gomseomensis]
MKALLLGCIMLAFSIPLAGLAADADGHKAPAGPVILRVVGDIDKTNVDGEAHFDRRMLQQLPQHGVETTTPWTDSQDHYEGPLMRDLLAHLGVTDGRVNVLALNGYEAEIPVSDFYDYDVILALKRDSEAIPIREYGPLWVLYPFDHDAALLSEKMRFRAVWQVMKINVR